MVTIKQKQQFTQEIKYKLISVNKFVKLKSKLYICITL